MKKIIFLMLTVALLTGCSGGLPDIMNLVISPTFTPMDTNTPQPTVTLIPTRDLFAISTPTPVTFTPTTTPLVQNFPTAEPTETETPRPTFSAPSNLPLYGSNIFTPRDEGFVRVLYSGGVIYWNEGPCNPRNIRINAAVVDPNNTFKVLLFMRLRNKKNTLDVTEWSSGAEMLPEEDGSYSYNIRTFNIPRYFYYKDAYLEYQLVAITKNFEETGRTQIYDRNISLVRCNPVQ